MAKEISLKLYERTLEEELEMVESLEDAYLGEIEMQEMQWQRAEWDNYVDLQ